MEKCAPNILFVTLFFKFPATLWDNTVGFKTPKVLHYYKIAYALLLQISHYIYLYR
jgi:hypothetical protein